MRDADLDRNEIIETTLGYTHAMNNSLGVISPADGLLPEDFGR